MVRGMRHSTGGFQTADGLEIHTETWAPEGEPKSGVVLAHGMGEHIGRYGHVAMRLAGAGYAVFGLDHRTHGKSGGTPRTYFREFDLAVHDLSQYIDLLSAKLSLFVCGHSMGSAMATWLALRRQDRLAGLISSGSPLAVDSAVPGWFVVAGNCLRLMTPRLPLMKLSAEGICRDPAVVAAWRTDPLVHTGRVRAGMAINFRMLADLRGRLGALRLPILALHGGDDRLTPAAGSRLLCERAGSQDKTLKIYPGLWHEIFNEPEKDRVLSDVIEWLEARAR
jgi:lysophospholipase